MTITKKVLADDLVDVLGLPLKTCHALVESVFTTIRDTLRSGETVNLSNFGNFNLRAKSVRPGRNPKTGEPCTIKARRVVTFSAGQKLRDIVRQRSMKMGEIWNSKDAGA